MSDGNEDIGDISDFQSPKIPGSILSAITDLIIDESFVSDDRVAEDIDFMLDAIGASRMEALKGFLARGDLAKDLCKAPSFIEAVSRRLAQFAEALNGIDFSDTGDL